MKAAEERTDASGAELDVDAFRKSLVSAPGVYRMLDGAGQVLYVGKARNLKKRLSSYLRGHAQLPPKTRVLMSHTRSVEVTVTHTETEALLLENNLIKEHRPRYNIVLRDDKSYPYIFVSTEQRFPRLAFHRGPRREQGRYFGPYASAGATRETLSQLQKLFQLRQCDDHFFRNRSRPCLQYQIKRCTAPCVGYVDETRYQEDVRHALMFLEGKSEEVIGELVTRMEAASERLDYEMAARYRDQIASLRRVQERQYVSAARGDIDVVAALSREGLAVVQVFFIRGGQNLGQKTIVPQGAADADAAEVLSAFLPQYYLHAPSDRPIPGEILVSEEPPDVQPLIRVLSERAGRRVAITHQVRGERARWLEMARANAELALAQRLGDRSSLRERFDALQAALELDEPPARIECFDVSHTRGEAPVASCVVFGPQGPVKSHYRRFNIRDVEPGDDYGALRQAVLRRYDRVKKEEGTLPDVILIDGGKGQLAVALEALRELQVTGICVVGVAKGAGRRPGLETLLQPEREAPLALAPDSPALHLVQQIRDEAHRFAITGHRNRRGRARRSSPLEEIPGIGAKRRQRLLREFGGMQGVARAGVEDLARVGGISRTLARAIYDRLREGS